MQLRDYQTECLEKIDRLPSGAYLVSMATGLGKTVVFSHIKRRGRMLVLSHREELVYQPIKYFDCPCGIEKAGEHSHGEQVVLASVQTLVKRLENFARDEFDIIITDEAHHAAAPSYKKIYSYFTPRLHIGFTATPNRGDKVRLDDVYDQIIFERNLKWGILKNYLCDVKCLRVKVSYDLKRVRRRMGDFVTDDLDRAINNQTSNFEVSKVYERYAVGQTLIFASSVSHAENIAALIDGAVVVSQKTANRSSIIKAFTERKIKCLVNCMIFTEGTDLPLIETIIIARPTQNASLYAQMVGRGLRQYPGKRYLTLIDLVGVSEMDVCAAPSLLGLDLDDVPKKYEGDLSGAMLTKMEERIESLRDCPENWVLNVQRVKLFADSFGANTHDVNWSKKANGSLVYQFSCGDRIGIKAVNELGKTALMRYVFN
ncbi:MAG: DEAD/DEAH box helicase [Clostridia bacterium]|nr:DEAD/DEAH box helicase [Clostridia bacterium]